MAEIFIIYVSNDDLLFPKVSVLFAKTRAEMHKQVQRIVQWDLKHFIHKVLQITSYVPPLVGLCELCLR